MSNCGDEPCAKCKARSENASLGRPIIPKPTPVLPPRPNVPEDPEEAEALTKGVSVEELRESKGMTKPKKPTENSEECPRCGAEMEDGECPECGYVENSIDGKQPRHETGQYLHLGAGTGAGPVHKSATQGAGHESDLGDPDEEPGADLVGGDGKGLDRTHNSFGPPLDPHQSSKDAAVASLDHSDAHKSALQAVKASGKGKSEKAAEHHATAAELHESMATDSRREDDHDTAGQHDNAAALHRKAASMHQASIFNRGSMGVPEARRAAFARMQEDGECDESPTCKGGGKGGDQESHDKQHTSKSQGRRNAPASKGAYASPGKGKGPPTHAEAKAKGYKGTATAYAKLKDSSKSNFARNASREYLVNKLCTVLNADEDESYMINSMSTPKIREILVNTAESSGSGSFDSATLAGGEDEENEGTFGSDDEFTDKTDSVKGKGVFGANAEDDDEDEEETMNQQWYRGMPRWAQEVLTNGRSQLGQTRRGLIESIVGHLPEGEFRRQVVANLQSRPLQDLRMMTALQRPGHSTGTALVPYPAYGPVTSQVTANVDTDDILPLPVMNYREDVG